MTTPDPVERMFRLLVRALRASRPALLTSAFSVGDIHQQILPYRHFRRDLGLETNQEYELTLMRLLSGAGGYLDVDERLRDGLGAELASNAPEPSKVRDYADAQVSISPAALASLGENEPRAAASAAPRPSALSCRYCSGALPQGREVHFCPHCGQNLQVHNCPACGAEIENDWKYCVACGKAVQ
jgi:hypothetical protein